MTCLTGHCVTCADEGIPMRVLDGEAGGGGEPGADATVRCRSEDGTEREVDVVLVEPVAPGDVLLVHAGVALTRLTETADRSPEDASSAGPAPRTAVTQGGPPP